MVDLARTQAHGALVYHAQQFDPPCREEFVEAVLVADVEVVRGRENLAFADGAASVSYTNLAPPSPLFCVSDVAIDCSPSE